jgi:hypothetical protein
MESPLAPRAHDETEARVEHGAVYVPCFRCREPILLAVVGEEPRLEPGELPLCPACVTSA